MLEQLSAIYVGLGDLSKMPSMIFLVQIQKSIIKNKPKVGEPASDSVSPSLSAPPLLALSFSNISKHKQK